MLQGLAEPLIMDNFPFTKKAQRFFHFRIIYDPQQVFIGGPGFLFWGDLVSTTYTKI